MLTGGESTMNRTYPVIPSLGNILCNLLRQYYKMAKGVWTSRRLLAEWILDEEGKMRGKI
jgi:hypothetical protein